MKIGMLFPGYGSQFVGMGKDLYDHARIIQEYFEQASHCLDTNFVKLCFASSDAELSKITQAYPALFLVGTATAALIEQTGLKIDYVAGQGIGEYSALCTASGLNFPDGLYLLNKLSHFYTDMREHLDIASVNIHGVSTRKLNQLCKDHTSSDQEAHIAVFENKNEHIVTGNTGAVEALAHLVQQDNTANMVTRHAAEEGLHSPLVQQLLDQIKIYLTKVDFCDLKIPLISNALGKEVYNAKKAQNVIINQIVKPVYWHNVVKQFNMVDIIIVPAPSKYLVTELKQYYPDKQIIGVDSFEDIEHLKQFVDEQSTTEISLEKTTSTTREQQI